MVASQQDGETSDNAHEKMANQNAKHTVLKQVVASPQAGETTDDAHEMMANQNAQHTDLNKQVVASPQDGKTTDDDHDGGHFFTKAHFACHRHQCEYSKIQ